MKRWMFSVVVLLGIVPPGFGQTNQQGDGQTFELTPSAATSNYWLMTDPRLGLPGDSALLYADAAAMLNDAVVKQIEDAKAAYWAKRDNFDALAAAVDDAKVGSTTRIPAVIDLLGIASRRDHYEWDSPFREQGAATLLPHLMLQRRLADLIQVRALAQIRAGKTDDAVDTLRLGYELGRRVGRGPLGVTGLVGVAIIAQTSAVTAELMKQPQSPNLYWALASLPRPMISFQHSWSLELIDLSSSVHELGEGKLEDLTGEAWRGIYKQAAELVEGFGGESSAGEPALVWNNEKTLADAVTHTLPQAREFYARTYKLPAAQVEALDAFKVVATYWYAQEQELRAEQYMTTALPYPMLLEKAEEMDQRAAQMRTEQPGNVFLEWIPAYEKAVFHWAVLDRTLAALTDVEAIRSYAAAHDGKLASGLDQISDTPVLDNPCTGKPFGYTVQGDTATLSDSDVAADPLQYTIRIRK